MSSGDFDLYINASPFTLNIEQLSNPEWIRGKPPSAFGNIETLRRPVVGRRLRRAAVETRYHWTNNRTDRGVTVFGRTQINAIIGQFSIGMASALRQNGSRMARLMRSKEKAKVLER